MPVCCVNGRPGEAVPSFRPAASLVVQRGLSAEPTQRRLDSRTGMGIECVRSSKPHMIISRVGVCRHVAALLLFTEETSAARPGLSSTRRRLMIEAMNTERKRRSSMQRLKFGCAVFGLGLALVLWGATTPAVAGEKIKLNVVTAGDTNMHELQKDVFGPAFSKQFPNVEINAVGSGPGGRNAQNEPNLAPGRCRAGTPNLRRAEERKTKPIWGSNRAKQTQSRPAGGD